jgi:hypothetical protein
MSELKSAMIYMLVSVDLAKQTGVFKMKPSSPKNAQWTEITVSLSPLLAWKIKNNDRKGLLRTDEYVGSKFESANTSPEFFENPFCLIKYIPIKGSDIPENYRLSLVNERRGFIQELKDAFGQKEERYVNKYVHPKRYLRYREVETSEMMKNLDPKVVVALQ